MSVNIVQKNAHHISQESVGKSQIVLCPTNSKKSDQNQLSIIEK